MATGVVGLATALVWFAIERVHIAMEPTAPHHHFGSVILGAFLSMVLFAVSLGVLVEGLARRSAAPTPRRVAS
jgi:hypothetical protein